MSSAHVIGYALGVGTVATATAGLMLRFLVAWLRRRDARP